MVRCKACHIPFTGA